MRPASPFYCAFDVFVCNTLNIFCVVSYRCIHIHASSGTSKLHWDTCFGCRLLVVVVVVVRTRDTCNFVLGAWLRASVVSVQLTNPIWFSEPWIRQYSSSYFFTSKFSGIFFSYLATLWISEHHYVEDWISKSLLQISLSTLPLVVKFLSFLVEIMNSNILRCWVK